jgi:hypothetical protein
MNDEEVAFRIVRLYFEEVARLGFKRTLDLDQMINAYFYTLKKLKGKDASLKALAEKIRADEKKLESKEVTKTVSVTTASVPVKETTTTTTTVTANKPISTTVSEVIESK